ncbi:MAG: prepilin-type N-terminal cleavage/methylation domain-containing protein, partial [Nitrospira sp.]|nr:prepilin-type N-terminal cleavage/methylation domain-containing protein [Nitrospira sp.]
MKLYGRFGNKQSGFTLIELAIVLIILGILVALGAALVGPLTKRSKYDESREVVKSAKEAVLGYVVKNGYLPADLETAGARKLDAWGNDLV